MLCRLGIAAAAAAAVAMFVTPLLMTCGPHGRPQDLDGGTSGDQHPNQPASVYLRLRPGPLANPAAVMPIRCFAA